MRGGWNSYELQAERTVSSALRQEMAEQQGNTKKTVVHLEEVVINRTEQLEAAQHQSKTQLDSVMAAFEKETKRLNAKLREVNKEWKEDATEWQVCPCLLLHPSSLPPSKLCSLLTHCLAHVPCAAMCQSP